MERHEHDGHTVWDLTYHLVWSTNYRYKVLKGPVVSKLEDTLKNTALAEGMRIHASHVHPDHVHLRLSIPPTLSVDKAIDHLKRDSNEELLWTFNDLKQRYWGGQLWSKGYWIGSSGNVSESMWQQYIRSSKPPTRC